MIKRIGYKAVRSDTQKSYKVAPACIKDVGKPGKTPPEQKIVTDDDLDLSVYGYTNLIHTKAAPRHGALHKAIQGVAASEGKSEREAAVKVMRRLNYLYVLTKNTQKTLNKILERDRNWISQTYIGNP